MIPELLFSLVCSVEIEKSTKYQPLHVSYSEYRSDFVIFKQSMQKWTKLEDVILSASVIWAAVYLICIHTI